MSFIQIIESRTKSFDELQALSDEFFAATEGKRTLQRSLVTRDRNDPDRYLIIVFFDSYESAMENSKLPVTQEFSQRMMALTDGPATFHNLDVIDDRS